MCLVCAPQMVNLYMYIQDGRALPQMEEYYEMLLVDLMGSRSQKVHIQTTIMFKILKL